MRELWLSPLQEESRPQRSSIQLSPSSCPATHAGHLTLGLSTELSMTSALYIVAFLLPIALWDRNFPANFSVPLCTLFFRANGKHCLVQMNLSEFWPPIPQSSSGNTSPSQIWNPEWDPIIWNPPLALGPGINYLLITPWLLNPTPSGISGLNGCHCTVIANLPDLLEGL